MTFAAALSEHPLPTQAAGEVIGEVLERFDGRPPDLALLFVTVPHAGALEDIARSVRETLRPTTLVGATAASVLGGSHEVEERAAVTLWAATFDPPPAPVRLETTPTADGLAITGLPTEAAQGARTLILVPDPFSFAADEFCRQAAGPLSDLTVVGGLASAAQGPGGNRLVLDDAIYTDGAVGALLAPGQAVATVVSQGCRPIGSPMVITRAERNIVYELAGKPALERLIELVRGLAPEEQSLVQQGLHVGLVIDERKPTFERGDFLVRNVLGAEREEGAIALGEIVELGSTVQFQVRDSDSADEDLRELLSGRDADAALVFTCNGRGSHLFGRPDHDAELVNAAVQGGATAGMFCQGELGPVGGRNFLHGFTASIALFQE